MKKFFIRTFGCQMNIYDSERVAVMLSKAGWEFSKDPDSADLIVINSCSVREKPLLKLYSCVGRYLPLKKSKGTKIFVMGCVAQQLGEKIVEKIPYIDGVFGPGAEDLIPEIVEKGEFPFVSNKTDLLEREEIFPLSSKGNFFGRFSSFVTIMHGCDNFCSYCIVPFLRGREISRRAASILEEIDLLTRNGVVEVVLLGQNVNSYRDSESGISFPELLYLISEKSSLKRIRFITSHPKDFGKELAEAFNKIPNLMPYLHLPAQSGSDRILKLMKRRYSLSDYIEKIELARKYCPDIALSSDFIVGFPTETRADFEKTMELVDLVGYDSIFAFNYSPRPFTQSEKMADDVAEGVKFQRVNELLNLQKQKMREVRKRYLGKTVGVLIESASPKGGSFMGRTERNLIAHVVNSGDFDRGKIIKVKITEILENTLRGEKVQ